MTARWEDPNSNKHQDPRLDVLAVFIFLVVLGLIGALL